MKKAPDQPATRITGGMIVREKEPVNLEMRFGSTDGCVTPVEHFYVRCHHPLPTIDLGKWRLCVEGDVEEAFELTFDELSSMETRTVTTTMECAGNGRVFLSPQRDGTQWEGGAIGTAEWTGVPLNAVLQRAGVQESVCEIILEGADKGDIMQPPRPAGKIHFSRSLPLSKANDNVLLALQMNGEDLTAEHGFPVRAVVPGWYGMAAVKWLTRIVASTEPYNGFYQTIDYAYWERGSSAPTLVPITEMRVKSQIARPEFAEAVRAGERYRVHGAAWTGDGEIVKVEVSVDGGTTWNEAGLLGDPMAHVWRLWEYQWAVPATPGKAVLMARATDSAGRTQPSGHDDDRGAYIIHHRQPIEVLIR